MKLASLLVVLMSATAAAGPVQTATGWITPVVTTTATVPAGTVAVEIGGNAISCARSATLTTQAELDRLAVCVRSALHAAQLDDPAVHGSAIAEMPLRWLSSWFERKLVVPRGAVLIGKSFDRATDHEGNGVGAIVAVAVDPAGHVTAAYIYVGRWSYPV